MLRGIVESAYTVPGQGVYVAVEMLSGPANAGCRIDLATRSGQSRIVTVAGIDLIEQRGSKARIALRIPGLDPSEVLVGSVVREIPDGD